MQATFSSTILLFVVVFSEGHDDTEESPVTMDDTFSSLQVFKNIRFRNGTHSTGNASSQAGHRDLQHRERSHHNVGNVSSPSVQTSTQVLAGNGSASFHNQQLPHTGEQRTVVRNDSVPTSLDAHVQTSATKPIAQTFTQSVAEDSNVPEPIGIPWSEAYQIPQDGSRGATEVFMRSIAARFVESSTKAIDFTRGRFLLMCLGVLIGVLIGLFMARCYSDTCPGGCGYCKHPERGSHCCEACHTTTGKLHDIHCRSYYMTWKGNKVHRAVEDVRKLILKQAGNVKVALDHEGEASAAALIHARLEDKLKWSSKPSDFKWSVKVFIEACRDDLRLELEQAIGDRADRVLMLAMRGVFSYDTNDYLRRVDYYQAEERRRGRESAILAIREQSFSAGRNPPIKAGRTVLK